MRWHYSNRADPRALPLADRHYNRQKPGTPQFVPPGRCAVFLTEDADALWVTSWPFAAYVKHEWAGAWVNSLFRNESEHLSSYLILEALAATRWHYRQTDSWLKEAEPEQGLITFVDDDEIKSCNPGFCYLMAGFERVGKTQGGLYALQMRLEDMPEPEEPKEMLKEEECASKTA